MDIRAAEISKVIKDQIANFGNEAQVSWPEGKDFNCTLRDN